MLFAIVCNGVVFISSLNRSILDMKFQEEFNLCSSDRTWEKFNKKNECVSAKHATGSVNLQGRGLGLLTGGMGMSQFCSEDIVHGCDVGELQQSVVCG